jgi:hypothetical protein
MIIRIKNLDEVFGPLSNLEVQMKVGEVVRSPISLESYLLA